MAERSTGQQAKTIVNRYLGRATGYELRRTGKPVVQARRAGPVIHRPPAPPTAQQLAALLERARPGQRLLRAPTFVLSTMRSGSTLLRLLLDSHPQVCAPHEVHLRGIEAKATGMAHYAVRDLGLDPIGLRDLLWDRLLERELQRSGKTRYVNKTPTDALIWSEILGCWPDARFVFLHRHPAAVVDSWEAAHHRTNTRDELAEDVYAFAVGMEQARRECGGLVVRYEDLTENPEKECRRLCDFLDVAWDPVMLDYGAAPHSGLIRGLGDWSEAVRSGVVQRRESRATAERVPAILRPIAAAWGYA